MTDLPLPDTDLSLPPGRDEVVTTDDGAALAVTVAGEDGPGAPVLLPHCWTGTRGVWVPVARRLLAAGHPVVLYDQRGHGASTTGADDITVARLGDDLAAVLEACDLGDAVVAGHSMGGMSTMACACRHGDLLRARVRGLALVATAAHGLGSPGRERAFRAMLSGDLVDTVVDRPRLGAWFVRRTFGRDPLPAHVEATRAMFAATDAAVRLDCAAAMGAMDLRVALRGVDVPAVVVLGSRDRLIVNGLTRRIVDHLSGADLVELPDAGHMLPFERPDEVAALIRKLAG